MSLYDYDPKNNMADALVELLGQVLAVLLLVVLAVVALVP